MKIPKDLIKEYVKRELFKSTADIMESIYNNYGGRANARPPYQFNSEYQKIIIQTAFAFQHPSFHSLHTPEYRRDGCYISRYESHR